MKKILNSALPKHLRWWLNENIFLDIDINANRHHHQHRPRKQYIGCRDMKANIWLGGERTTSILMTLNIDFPGFNGTP